MAVVTVKGPFLAPLAQSGSGAGAPAEGRSPAKPKIQIVNANPYIKVYICVYIIQPHDYDSSRINPYTY